MARGGHHGGSAHISHRLERDSFRTEMQMETNIVIKLLLMPILSISKVL